MNVRRERKVWIWLWWVRTAALWVTSNGIFSDIHNGGHVGGAVAGFFIGLTELQLKGPARTLFIFAWLLMISVWARISSKFDPSPEKVFSPDSYYRNVSMCASQCLQCVEVCDADNLCTSQCHQCLSECNLCVSECYLDTGNYTQ